MAAIEKSLDVEVGTKRSNPRLVREGYSVPTPEVDKAKADFFVDNLKPIDVVGLPRVVRQSVAPGTAVPKGTTVDITVAPRQVVPWDIFGGIHAGLKGKTIDALDPVLADPGVRQIVLTKDNPADLNEAEKKAVGDAFEAAGIHIVATDPERNLDKAYNSARVGVAFR